MTKIAQGDARSRKALITPCEKNMRKMSSVAAEDNPERPDKERSEEVRRFLALWGQDRRFYLFRNS